MPTNDYTFSHPADPGDVHGTSWINNAAGQGKQGHRSFNRNRWAARQVQPGPVPLPVVESPLQTDKISAFAEGIAHDSYRDVGQDGLAGTVIGAAVGYALWKRRDNKNGRTR